MSAAAPTTSRCGVDLKAEDYRRLEERWITPEIADAAGLRRVDSFTARDILGRKSGNLAGILIPNTLPGTTYAREYRVRLDEPNGNKKYLSPAGRPNLAYFPPVTPAPLLADVTVTVIITEGEFKTLALWRLATHESDTERFMPLGFAGVWSFRGTIGKKTSSTGERIDEKGVIADVERVTWQGRKVLIAYDADAPEKEQVRIARAQLARELRSRGASVAFLEWDIATGKGIDDHLVAVGPDVVLGEIAAIDFERRDWRANLILNRAGEPRALLANAITALRQSPEWEGVLAFNEFSIGVVALKPKPWGGPAGPWTDHEDRLTADWLQHQGIHVSVEIAGHAVQSVAHDRTVHPVREYLDSLGWDRTSRIDGWLSRYLGAEQNDYTAAVGARWLISAVARIYSPGAKADCCLILEGEQGSKKSTALKTIAWPWFSDEIAELGSKDAALQTRGVWVIEIAELDAMGKPEVSKIKAFMSRSTDRFRPPYGKRVIESARQCVFAGSVNHLTYLRDETGGRRFWPVACTGIVIDDLIRDRDQLWAEAVARFRAGETWWLDTVELTRAAEQEQAERYEGDPWDGLISAWIDGRESVSIQEVLELCIEKPKGTWSQKDKTRVARCLRALGWEKFRPGARKARERRYRPSDRSG